MIIVSFGGTSYLFIGDSLDESGAIATPEAFRTGCASYAHYWPDGDGRILRYGEQIGTRADLTVIGPAPDVHPQTIGERLTALGNLLSDESWKRADE